MSKETMDFKREMEIAFKKIEKKSAKVVKKTFVEIFTNIIDDTPFGRPELWRSFPSVPSNYRPGTLKANWTATEGSASSSFNEGLQDLSGQQTVGRMRNTVEKWQIRQPLYFSNSAPYVEEIEMGKSTQIAPYAMFRSNIRRFDEILNRNAKKEANRDGSNR